MKNSDYNIFYADDDIDDRELFREIINEISGEWDVYLQDSGDALLKLLQNPPPKPSVIFLDLNMPRKSGFDVLEEIRSSAQMHNIPVVIISTSNDEQAITRSKMLGANLYVPKPSSYSDYKKILRQVLELNWSQQFVQDNEFVFTTN